jgi:transcriptional regulator with XRE-family HTH domain
MSEQRNIHPVDQHVGKRIRQRRWAKDMTQQRLGDLVGVKFQQIQKYETGGNRVSASRLWQISMALDVSVSFFYNGLERTDEGGPRFEVPLELAGDMEALELVRAYNAMPIDQRRNFYELAKSLAQKTA